MTMFVARAAGVVIPAKPGATPSTNSQPYRPRIMADAFVIRSFSLSWGHTSNTFLGCISLPHVTLVRHEISRDSLTPTIQSHAGDNLFFFECESFGDRVDVKTWSGSLSWIHSSTDGQRSWRIVKSWRPHRDMTRAYIGAERYMYLNSINVLSQGEKQINYL